MALILAADDDYQTRVLMAAILRTSGHEVLQAGDGLAAISTALRRRPDVLLLDWVMPNLSGLDICARLRREPAFADTRILLVSGLSSEFDEMQAMLAGADGYIRKPFGAKELRRQVDAALGSPVPAADLPGTGSPAARPASAPCADAPVGAAPAAAGARHVALSR